MNKKTVVITILFFLVFCFSVVLLITDKTKTRQAIENIQTPTGIFSADVEISSSSISQNGVPSSSVASSAKNQAQDKIILFYGDGCSHCALVEKFIKDNNIQNKVSFVEKEVFGDDVNANELVQKATTCGVATDSVGVPFLWDGSHCVIGDEAVINFFKQKTNIQ